MTLYDVLKGIIGRAKVAGGIDRAPAWLHADRLALCMRCPALDGSVLDGGRCRDCGCPVDLKARVKAERCPRGRW